MRLRLLHRLMWSECHGAGGRFLFFVTCLAIGVAAIVCVAGLSANLDRRIRSEARQLLAADLAIRGRQPAPEAVTEYLGARPDLEVATTRELATIAATSRDSAATLGRSQLVELKVVSAGYPFYGEIVTVPAAPLLQLLTPSTVVVAPELLAQLRLEPGEELRVGGVGYQISGSLLRESDGVASPFSVGPRVLMSSEAFDRTDLEQLGSRIVYRLLVKLPAGYSAQELEDTAQDLRQRLAGSTDWRVETFVDTREDLRQALGRATSFLALIALLSLLLGGLGVAQATRAWLAGRMDDIAILRCLGLRPNEVLTLYLGQTAILGLIGSCLGIAAGLLVLAALPRVFPELLAPSTISVWQPTAIGRGLGLGMGVALLFSLQALLTVRLIPPLRVLRKDVEPVRRGRKGRAALVVVLGIGIATAASVQAGSAARGVVFAAGIALATTVLAAASWAMVRLSRYPAQRLSTPWIRHGLLAASRPGAATLGAVVALGLGVLLICGIQLVRDRLADELRGDLPTDAPTAFLINIQPSQWPEVSSLLTAQGVTDIQSVPIVTARLRAIDGRPVSEMAQDLPEGDRRWALTREQRLTYLSRLPEDNVIVEGALWQQPNLAEVSIEEEFAKELGAGLGSRLLFDIQGISRELTVTSIRSVDWRTFGINFFLVVEPGILDDAPQQRIASIRLAAGSEQAVQDRLASSFPNVTLLRIREILEKIAVVIGYLARGVRFIGGFTVITGAVILAGGIGAQSVQRRKQIALLKTLGMTQHEIAGMLSIEFALIGTLAGLIGTIGGTVLSWAVVTRGFDLPWQIEPTTLLVFVAASICLTSLFGILASRRALSQRPASVLRGD